MKMEMKIETLKCYCSRVHLFTSLCWFHFVSLLLFEKDCVLNFVPLPGIVHVFEEHVCGHCFSENIHYGTFLEFFWRGIKYWRLAGPVIGFVTWLFWLSNPVVCSSLGRFGYHEAAGLGSRLDVGKECVSSACFWWHICKLRIRRLAWQG